MPKTKVKQTVDVLTLDYQLAELPSSQHRAGLAGLVLVVQWLERQPAFQKKVAAGAICRLTPPSSQGTTLELNKAGLAALFDEVYAASTEEQARAQPLKNKQKEIIPPRSEKEQEEINSKGERIVKKVYIYPITVPRGSFLADTSFDSSSDGNHCHWIKLWRDLVWQILRGVPATRKPFEGRANGVYTKDIETAWKQLAQPTEYTVDLPSTYYLGAQANNADNIPFKDRARLQFLLHFWLFTVQVYVPAVINNEGKRDFVGYALAIPDVADLKRFCKRLPKILQNRSPEISGYRPRDCIVDLAVEGALDLMRRLGDRLTQTTGEQSTASTVFGIDVFHAVKQGNNVRLLSMERLHPEASMIDEYVRIRDGFWSPIFRRQCLLNLVKYRPWYSDFSVLLCTRPYELSIGNDYFRHDVRKKLEELVNEEEYMSNTQIARSVRIMIFQLIQNYVRYKLRSKYELEWKPEWKNLKAEELKKQKAYQDYSEKKSKIAKSAFLDIRSRTEPMDFINYFASSLCSVPQHIKSEDYVELTQALYADPEQIRTLTLLALSANG